MIGEGQSALEAVESLAIGQSDASRFGKFERAQKDLAEIAGAKDPLRRFREIVHKEKAGDLPHAETRSLRRDMESDDDQEREKAWILLTWDCLHTVSSVMNRFDQFFSDKEELFDLTMSRLQEKILSWRPEFASPLSRYVYATLSTDLEKEVTDQLQIPGVDFETAQRYFLARREFFIDHEREPDFEELEELMTIASIEQEKEGKNTNEKTFRYIHSVYNSNLEGPPKDIPSSRDIARAAFAHEDLHNALSKLKKIELYILWKKYGEDATLKETGESIGRTTERIRQIRAKAEKHTRKNLFFLDREDRYPKYQVSEERY